MPKVSIITVVYNAVDKIAGTIENVLAQDYANLEYLVIDGGSTDGTVEVIKRHRDRISYFVSEKDGGIYDAMNKGVKAATGDWIGVMNAGDHFSSNTVLSEIFGGSPDYSGIDVVYGDAVGTSPFRKVVMKGTENIDDLAVGPAYRHGASFVRRETHLKYLFDLGLRQRLGFALDYEQIHRMYKGGCRFRRVPVTVLEYEIGGVSNSPFKGAYYNHLITHDMKCTASERMWLYYHVVWDRIMREFKR